jgi:hypothetical protein
LGRPNPNNVALGPHPLLALTVGHFVARGWTVTAYCRRCGVRQHADLAAITRARGAGFILWGAHPRCKTYANNEHQRCDGRIIFQSRAVYGAEWVDLTLTQGVLDACALFGLPPPATRPRRAPW